MADFYDQVIDNALKQPQSPDFGTQAPQPTRTPVPGNQWPKFANEEDLTPEEVKTLPEDTANPAPPPRDFVDHLVDRIIPQASAQPTEPTKPKESTFWNIAKYPIGFAYGADELQAAPLSSGLMDKIRSGLDYTLLGRGRSEPSRLKPKKPTEYPGLTEGAAMLRTPVTSLLENKPMEQSYQEELGQQKDFEKMLPKSARTAGKLAVAAEGLVGIGKAGLSAFKNYKFAKNLAKEQAATKEAGGIVDQVVNKVLGPETPNVEMPKMEPSVAKKIPAMAVEVSPGIEGKPTLTTTELPEVQAGKVGNLNLDRLNTPDDVRSMLKDISEQNASKMEAAKRGKISFQETKNLADELGMTPEQLLRRRKGQAFNAEEATGAKQILVASAENTWNKAKQALETGDMTDFVTQLERHIDVQSEVTAGVSEAARTVSAQRMRFGSAEYRERALKRLTQAIGGKEGVTEEIAKRIAMIDPADTQAINEFVRQTTKAKTADQVYEVWVSGILSGPVTHAVNMTSNAVAALIRPTLERPLSAAFELPVSLATRTPRERFFGEAPADLIGQALGMWQGMKNGAKAFIKTIGLEKNINIEATPFPSMTGTKLETVNIPAIKGKLGSVIRSPLTALSKEDEIAKGINYTGDLYARAYRQAAKEGNSGKKLIQRTVEIIKNPSDELKELAKGEAIYRTFNKPLGKWGNKFIALRNDVPGVRYVIPFIRTPVNIEKFALERTPLEFANIGYKIAKGTISRQHLADQLAHATGGSAIAAWVMEKAVEGKITGFGPTKQNERKTWLDSGARPYSVKIGHKWYQYGRIEPLGSIIGTTADLHDIFDAVEQEDPVSGIVKAITRNFINKTFMSGLYNFMTALEDPERYGARWTSSVVGGVIPNLVAQFTRATEPTILKPKGTEQSIRARIPGVSKEDIIPIYSTWGKPVERGGSGFMERIISPIQIQEVNEDPATKEAMRLKVYPGSPRNELGNVKLDDATYRHYIELSGQLSHERVIKMMNSPEYQNADDIKKTEKFEKAIREEREKAKNRILLENPGLRQKIRDKKKGIVPTSEPSDLFDKIVHGF